MDRFDRMQTSQYYAFSRKSIRTRVRCIDSANLRESRERIAISTWLAIKSSKKQIASLTYIARFILRLIVVVFSNETGFVIHRGATRSDGQ